VRPRVNAVKIALLQINPLVGDLTGNRRMIADAVREAGRLGADLQGGDLRGVLQLEQLGGPLHVGEAAAAQLRVGGRVGAAREALAVDAGLEAADLVDLVAGETAVGATALPAGIPIQAMIGDSHAALYGHGIREPGTVKATYGTGSSLMTPTTSRVQSRHGLSSTIAWSTQSGGVAYALEGNVSVSGQAASFMADLLGIGDVGKLAELAMTVPNANGVHFVPALVGLGAPYWQADARGIISGLALGTRPAHLARASIEAIAFQVADVFAAMEADAGYPLRQLSADGGAARNDALMQFQADLIGRPVVRGSLAEVSAAGAAMLAFAARGKPGKATTSTTVFAPRLDDTARAALLAGWHDAVARALQPHSAIQDIAHKGEK